jgi:hypothetical protein
VGGGLGPVAVDVGPAAEDAKPVLVAEDALVAGEPEEEGCYELERAQKHGWLRRVAEVGVVRGG